MLLVLFGLSFIPYWLHHELTNSKSLFKHAVTLGLKLGLFATIVVKIGFWIHFYGIKTFLLQFSYASFSYIPFRFNLDKLIKIQINNDKKPL